MPSTSETGLTKSVAYFNYPLIIAATLSAFTGAFICNQLLKKVTINTIQYIVATMLFIFALLLELGII